MRRVIGTEDRQRPIGDSLQQRIHICGRTQRRIHLVVCIEILDRFVRQRDVMRANFAADFHAARPRFTNQPHAASGRDVLAMNVVIAKFREQDVAHHHRFLAHRRPAGQPEQRAPVAFVHHAIADEIVILTVVEHGHTNHSGIFNRAPHYFVILHALTIVGNRDDAGLCE